MWGHSIDESFIVSSDVPAKMHRLRVAILYSGGKDSNLALYKASKYCNIGVLVSFIPKSCESMLFHFPNAHLIHMQAEALGVPLIITEVGDSEDEQMEALYKALEEAIKKYNIEGVVTGAIRSTYQAARFQKVCKDLDLWCFNPLWLRDEESIIQEILSLGFKVIVTRLAAYPFEDFLGKCIDTKFVEYLKRIRANVAGEGGEYETFVLDMPLFRKRIEVMRAKKVLGECEGSYIIEEARLVKKRDHK